jgi:hypothetical protein
MPTGRHSNGPATDGDEQGLSRRRFLRAAGVGTAGAMVAAGAVAGQAGAESAGLQAAGPTVPSRRRVGRPGSTAGTQAGAAVQAVVGPLAFHTISPLRYLDTRFDGGGPFPPQGAAGQFFIFDFGAPDYFAGGVPNEVPAQAKAIACNLTVTSGTSGGNLRAFPANIDAIPLVSNVNWTTGQTVANYAIVAASTPDEGDFQAAVALHNASTRGSVHVIVDISGYFI